MASDYDWGLDFSELSSHVERLGEALRHTADSVRDRDSLPPSLASSIDELVKIRELTAKLKDRLDLEPLSLYVDGYLLSREQYYLLVARGILTFRLEEREAYDHFRMFHYEDDERRCYINPDERPLPKGTIKLQLGSPPEAILWSRLRPEQQEYFQEQQPDVAVRFRRERPGR